MSRPLRFLSLFSGIEAVSAAWLPFGWECAAVAEIVSATNSPASRPTATPCPAAASRPGWNKGRKISVMKTTTKIHVGDLNAQAGVVYDFVEIKGCLHASGADTKTAFPKLTAVGGYLDATGADTKTAFPKLTAVGVCLHASGADTKTAFPRLKKPADPSAAAITAAALASAFANLKLDFSDRILSRIVAKKGPVMRVIIIGKTKHSFLIERDGKTAHGATLAAARADLIMKIGKRDTTKYKAWTLETEASLEEMIVAYRTITGACGQGVSLFMAEQNHAAKITVGYAIEKTRGRYGHDTFRIFFAPPSMKLSELSPLSTCTEAHDQPHSGAETPGEK